MAGTLHAKYTGDSPTLKIRTCTMPPQTKDEVQSQNQGIDRIVDRYRQQFRIPENLDHYSDNDLHEAERQYLRFCLNTGSC